MPQATPKLKIVDIEEFKSLAGIQGTSHDGKLTLLGGGAESFVENVTGQDLGGNSWDENYTGDNTDTLILAHFPITALTTVELLNTPDPAEPITITGADKQVRVDRGGQLIRIDGGVWRSRPVESIHVVYTSKQPGRDMVMALYDMMEHRWRTQKLIGLKSERLGNYAYEMSSLDEIPGLKDTLKRYTDPARKIK